MKNKIESVQAIVVDFVQYLENSQKNAESFQLKLIEIMRENALDTIHKLKKMHKMVEANPEFNKTVEQRVYKKLIEHIARVQEAIHSCLYREYLGFRAADINCFRSVETNTKLAKYQKLQIISGKLADVLPLPSNWEANPTKHWLSEQWKKADAALQMQTAIKALKKKPDDLLVDLCKTVMFSEKYRQAITTTTRKTTELTKTFPDAEQEINQAYYKSISAFQWDVPEHKLKAAKL